MKTVKMKRKLSSSVAAVVIVAVILVVGFLFWKAAAGKPPTGPRMGRDSGGPKGPLQVRQEKGLPIPERAQQRGQQEGRSGGQ